MAKKPMIPMTTRLSPSQKGMVVGNGWKIKERKNERLIEPSPHVVESTPKPEPAGIHSQTMVASGSTLPGAIDQDPEQTWRKSNPTHHTDGHERSRRRRLWRSRPIWLLAGISAATVALMVSDVLWQWLGPEEVSGLATAEARPSSAPTPGQETNRVAPTRQAVIGSTLPQNRTTRISDTVTVPHVVEAVASRTSDESVDGPQQLLPSGGYRLQLQAYRKETDARYAWTRLRADLGLLLDGLDPYFERVKNEDGTFYRVQAGTFPSHNEADGLCARLKERDVSCSIVRR